MGHRYYGPIEDRYARDDLFDPRHELLTEWADYLAGAAITSDAASEVMKLSEDEEAALLRRVDDVRAEHDRQAKVDALFDREHRIKCRDLILSGLPALIEVLEDPVGLADVDDVFINGLVDVPGYPQEHVKATKVVPSPPACF